MKRWIYMLLILIFAVVFLLSGYKLLQYYMQSNQAEGNFDQIAQIVQQAKPQEPAEQETDLPEREPTQYVSPHVQITDPQTGKILWLLPEYAQIYTMNTDTVGWICIEGTRINYPVMHRPDSRDYYLKRDFYKKKSIDGSIYIREECNVFTPTDNVTIYGHRMNSGAMFADLLKYKEQDFWEDHRYIQFDTIQEHHTYEIISAFKISASSNNGFQYHTFVDMDRERFSQYVQQCKERAFYDTGVSAQYGDKLITLSTCEKGNSGMRIVVVAKQIA